MNDWYFTYILPIRRFDKSCDWEHMPVSCSTNTWLGEKSVLASKTDVQE